MVPEFNSGGLMYKVTAFAIFIILVALIVLISISSKNSDERLPASNVNDQTSSEPSTDTTPPDTTPITDAQTTEPPVTQAPVTDPPDTTPPETTPPVTSNVTSSAVSDPVDVPVGNTPEEIAAYLALYPNTVLGETEDAGQEYIDKLIFLGDSTTYGLRAYKMLNGGRDTTQVWTPKSGTLTLSQVSFATIVYPETDEEITIKTAVEAKKPEYLVITLGVNGVSFMKEDYFKSEYSKLIKTVQETSPDTKIICQSIFPVARNYESLGSINNSKIDEANRWICEVADECGVKYIDTNSALRDEEGWLPEEYQNGDGMHLNSTSFTIELNNLRTHAYIEE
ncbi:MAG: hypothetical protein HFE63_08330 [Clostridiales bacterium]|nr:hypothetical protein [Clostridiales bacterium]